MAVIQLNARSIANIKSKIRQMENEAENSQQKVSSALMGLDFEVAAKENIRARLTGIKNSLNKQENLAQRYGNAFAKVTESLIVTDTKAGRASSNILDKITECLNGNDFNAFFLANKLQKNSQTSELFLKEKSVLSNVGKNVFEVLKKAGHFGALITLIDGIVSGDNIAKIGKAGYKFIDGIIKDAKKLTKIARTGTDTKPMWAKRIFGIKDYIKSKKLTISKAKNISTRWSENFSKILHSAEEMKDIKAVSKSTWIGLAFDGVINAIDNYKEHGGITTRMVAETAVETAWNVGVGLAATAAVAATLGAVFGGAPAIAVAGGAFLVTKGLDVVTNWITGTDKGFTETVSDVLVDSAENIGKGLGNVITKASNAIKAGWRKCFV